MLGRFVRAASLLVLLLMQGAALAQAPQTWAYFAWWLPDSWRTERFSALDRLLFFEISVNGKGEIVERNGWPERWTDLRAAAKAKQIPVDLTLTLFDPHAFDALFSSERASRELLDGAMALAADAHVAGIHIDFEVYEKVRPAALAGFQRFVLTLSSELKKMSPPRSLSVFFPMGGASVMYEPATLAGLEMVVMQGYDAHWKGSATAGPVAPVDGKEAVTWRNAVTLADSLGVSRERILMSFPFYGYEWPVKDRAPRSATSGSGELVSFAPLAPNRVPAIKADVQARVREHGASHDALSASSRYTFKNADGNWVEAWFEDWWSLNRKIDFVRRERLGGMAFFVLGYDNDELLDLYIRRAAAHAPSQPDKKQD